MTDWCLDEPPAPVPFPPDGISGEALEKYLTDTLMPGFEHERCRLRKLEAWGTGKQPYERSYKNGVNNEKKVLQQFARRPWLRTVVNTFAQQLIVDGYRKEGAKENEQAWATWVANKMPSQQLTINRGTQMYGYTYLSVTSGVGVDDTVQAVMRVVDPQNAFGLYADPGDEYPMFLLERRFDGSYRWWTPENYVILHWDGTAFKVSEVVDHDYGVVPFVRYVNQIDARGRCWGEVEPFVDIAACIDKTVNDRLLVQHNNSWKVRYATGLEQPDTEEEAVADAWQLQHGDLLASSNEQAKFGTLDETSMADFISAVKRDIEDLITNAQLPPDVAGNIANLAADALEAARRPTYQKLFEKQLTLGQSHAQALRLAAAIEGREDDANDFSARIHWQDVQIQSLAQFADAWGKLSAQNGVPKDAAWHRIPGVEQSEVEEWRKHLLDDDPLTKYLRELGVKPVGMSAGPGGTTSLQNQPKPEPGL
jgi:hypothetical protein